MAARFPLRQRRLGRGERFPLGSPKMQRLAFGQKMAGRRLENGSGERQQSVTAPGGNYRFITPKCPHCRTADTLGQAGIFRL